MASMVQDKIDYHESIIQSQKASGEDWTGHATRVNKELRPLLRKINGELMESMMLHKWGLDATEINHALQLNEAVGAKGQSQEVGGAASGIQ